MYLSAIKRLLTDLCSRPDHSVLFVAILNSFTTEDIVIEMNFLLNNFKQFRAYVYGEKLKKKRFSFFKNTKLIERPSYIYIYIYIYKRNYYL